MSETVTVNFSSTALSFLLFENAKSTCEQEGFLLGETNVVVTKTITDSDSQAYKIRKIINISSVVPCPKTCAFYDYVGKIQADKMELILGDAISSVVAWYRYEPDNKYSLTIRDEIIHKELSTSGLFAIPTELFSFCVLSSTVSTLGSNHAFTHKFLRYYKEQFVNVPLHISNLGEISNSYKPKVPATKYFSDLCKSIGVPKKEIYDFKSVDKIQDKLQNELIKVMANLTSSERRKQELEEEYEKLRQQKQYYQIQLAEKQLKILKLEEERKMRQEKDKAEQEILNLIDLDLNKYEKNLSIDLPTKRTINKTDESFTSSQNSENLIDLTFEEPPEEFISTKKISYANMAKKK